MRFALIFIQSFGSLAWALSLLSTHARAADTSTAFGQIPSRFTTTELTAGSRGLGELCLSRDTMPDGTVCNPAFLTELNDSLLLGRVFVGNGYTAFTTANEFVNGTPSKEFLQDLFRQKNVTSLETHVGLIFATRYFSAGFSPYRLQYTSELHNPNFPVVAVHAALERSFTFAGGVPASAIFSKKELHEYSVGAKLRLLERKYVHSSFSLLQATTENRDDFLPVKSQRVAFLDPYLGWSAPTRPLKPRASIAVTNVGILKSYDPLYPDQTDLSLGAGIEPPVAMGRWRLGLDLVNLLHAEDFASRFRAGTSYKLGIMEPMIGATSRTIAVGTQFGIEIIQAGIVYEFVRSDLGGTALENRIATEFSVKL